MIFIMNIIAEKLVDIKHTKRLYLISINITGSYNMELFYI